MPSFSDDEIIEYKTVVGILVTGQIVGRYNGQEVRWVSPHSSTIGAGGDTYVVTLYPPVGGPFKIVASEYRMKKLPITEQLARAAALEL